MLNTKPSVKYKTLIRNKKPKAGANKKKAH